jgi:hypothetical protein
MNYQDFYSYQMILHVGEFGARQAASFPPTSFGGQLFARVSAAAAELEQHFAQQSSGRAAVREGTASKAVGRAALREMLESMRNTARSLAEEMPELEARFRLPRSHADHELVVTAEAFLADATPIKSDFIRYAMPADFLDRLSELIADFRTALETKQSGRANRVMANAAIDDTLEEAISAVRKLNAIVRNTFANDPERLAAWTAARHVTQPGRALPPPVEDQITVQAGTAQQPVA